MSLKDRLSELEKCLKKFEEVLSLEKDDVVRDSAIKRFELCFELSWKTLKDFLTEEGILCRSPKSCLKEAFSMGLIQDEDEWLSILEDRNLSVHTYDEALAEELYNRLPDHLKAMKNLAKAIKSFK
ncbi:HI0074 family nucleotidyltransferase substrate-binding subunit [Persephonella sp.]